MIFGCFRILQLQDSEQNEGSMKLLLVLGSDKTYDTISLFFSKLGFELIRYRHIQKAMDNIDEIDPSGIIISANDFPRHWKIMSTFVRHGRNKDQCPIIILKGKSFAKDEYEKASLLEINSLISESMEDSAELEEIKKIVINSSSEKGAKMNKSANFSFIFSNPHNEKLVTGTIKGISMKGISFEPDHPNLTEKIMKNTQITKCSLKEKNNKSGNNFFSPICLLRQNGKVVYLEFFSFPGSEEDVLEKIL